MTETATSPRCGTQSPPGAGLGADRQAPLDTAAPPDAPAPLDAAAPTPANAARPIGQRVRRGLGAAMLAALISAVGAFAIYEVHRTMPAVPPGFERVARGPAPVPPPDSGDEARLSHLRRPDPAFAPTAPTAPTAPASDGRSPPAALPVEARSPSAAGPAQKATAASPGRAGQPASVVARQGDRLAAVQQAQCGSEALLARFVCNERVRLRFCRDRWNAHPDCETGPAPKTVD
ncbi:MAG: hypothetical protein M9907_14985 [Burkholderiaceae bacterium]|nr:hypothetical protein [Burkholderiaceae bacterium]